VALGTAQRSNIELDLSAGELTLGGGAQALLEGALEYNVSSWRPEIHTSVIGNATDVTIKQPEGHPPVRHVHYKWQLAANNDLLTDVAVNCGAGKADMQLGSLRLRTVNVNLGAGQVDLDLRGHPKRDYDVSVSGGVGQATVYLPQGVGIEAEARGGIGHIEVRGLHKQGDIWRNDLYDTAKVTVRVKVNGGIGEIRIIAD
jgi:N-terminal domain of toast_rack, DUF2154